jgi:hypothetical protein
MNRRQFLKGAAAATVAVGVGGIGYGFAEAGDIRVERVNLTVRNLPTAFNGFTVAFLTDIHHGPYVSREQVAGIVRTTRQLRPDLIVLGGDYCLRDGKYIAPCFEVLKNLRADFGVFGVLGNHDYQHGLAETKAGMRTAGITELTNAGVWLTKGGARLRLAGIDDLWRGKPDLVPALGDCTAADACVLVSHNPDFAERTLRDERVGLVLSGHTHGGQVIVPWGTNPFIPSAYGDKYAHGLVAGPTAPVYVSRGLGVTGVPVRYNCPPELSLLTLRPRTS